jgi:hypothetical protein
MRSSGADDCINIQILKRVPQFRALRTLRCLEGGPAFLVSLRGNLFRCAVAATAMLLLLGACESPEQRQAAQHAQTREQAAAEIDRICALPAEQREAELKKIERESGVMLYCAK